MNLEKELAYLLPFISENRALRFDDILKGRTKHFTVVLEDLYQKHNQSAIVRSCDVFGVQDIHVIENKYVSYMSNHVAKGSHKWLSFINYNELEHNTQSCIDNLKANDYQIVATTPHNDSCLLADFDVTKKTAFVFGVEKAGVSKQMLDQADGYLKIPMVGFTESLNVSVACAIVLQQVTNKLKKTNVLWQLTNKEKLKLKLNWTKKTIKNIDLIMERYDQQK